MVSLNNIGGVKPNYGLPAQVAMLGCQVCLSSINLLLITGACAELKARLCLFSPKLTFRLD